MTIEQVIDSLIQNIGGVYREWYVGLAINPRQRLFDGHHVNEKSDIWICKDAGSETAARNIEAVFLKKGCKGGVINKDSSRHIYAYKMTRTTKNFIKIGKPLAH